MRGLSTITGCVVRSLLLSVLLGLCSIAWAQLPPAGSDQAAAQAPPPLPTPPAPQAPTTGLARWLNPSTAPFIPVPEIATDPNGGTTYGVLPVWLRSNASHEIDQIVAPDLLYNTYFGVGMHARLYEYPSEDEQWSVVGGIKERVEREFDLEYQAGRSRLQRWTFTGSVISDRDGTPRFYGIGNETPESAQTSYIAQQQLVRGQIGLNLSKAWQLAYTGRIRLVDVLPGTLSGIPSIQQRFGNGVLGSNPEFLHRLSLIYDTRDDLTIPTRGMELVAYGGLASRNAFLNDSLYREVGFDGRVFWPILEETTLAVHTALRYLIGDTTNVPFWALSTLGGGRSEIDGEQPLRGFGAGRFTDRDSFSTTVEWRRRLFSFDAISTHVDLEVTPFVDAGRVFAQSSTNPLEQLHHVFGIGFRGIARPYVVGFVDIGYGSEGSAIFTGLNFPF
jgi:hypothetical protein